MPESDREKIARLVTRSEPAQPASRPGQPRSASGGSAPFVPALKPHPRTVKVYVAEETYRALKVAGAGDDVPIAARLRALTELMLEQPELFEAATERAQRSLEEARQAAQRWVGQ